MRNNLVNLSILWFAFVNINTIKCLTIALLLLLPSFNSQAIIIRHDRADSFYQSLSVNYSASVAYLDKCVATVLSEYWLITASHCVSVKNKYPVYITHQAVKYPVAEIVLHPKASELDDIDIALLRLDWPLKSAKPVAIYPFADEQNKQVVFIGKGMTGSGITGDKIKDNIERAATNTVFKVEENWLNFQFNQGDNATDLEGISGNEDSGGPAFILTAKGITIAGVGCCQEPAVEANGESKQGGYSSVEFYSRLSPHKAWIDGKVSQTVTENKLDSPILTALKLAQFQTARSLLDRNLDWLKSPELATEVLLHTFYRSYELTSYLLTRHASLRTLKIKGLPLTVYAYLQGNEPIFSLLIKLGVAMDYSGFRGQQLPSLISWQYFNDDYEKLLTLLLQQGFDINHADESGNTALNMAIFFGDVKRVKALLDNGANIHLVDRKGNSALMDAARSGHQDIVELLLAHGAKREQKNSKNQTAIDLANLSGYQQIAQLISSYQ